MHLKEFGAKIKKASEPRRISTRAVQNFLVYYVKKTMQKFEINIKIYLFKL
jgi:hypothetical protein